MLLDIDGALVVYEGLHRLRWSHYTGPMTPAPARSAPVLRRVIDRVWPDKAAQAQIRRQIEHGRRVVVVFDQYEPAVVVPADCVPSVPVGSVVTELADSGSVSVSIPPFTWLSSADRARGEAFSAQAQLIAGRLPDPARPPLLVEGALVGTREPLRFVFETRSMTIDMAREVVRHLYTTRNSTTINAASAQQHSVPLSWLFNSKAA